MNDQLTFIDEPELTFGFDQPTTDPRDGLFLFGPLLDRRKPPSMRIGVIGTLDGLFAYRQWVEKIRGYIPAAGSSRHQFAFPGFEAAFRTEWPAQPVIEVPIAKESIAKAIRISDRHVAVHDTVTLFADAIKKAVNEEEIGVDLWFVVIPDDVYLYGRPLSRVPKVEQIVIQHAMNRRLARQLQSEPSLFVEDMKSAEVYLYGVDFHNQLKARLLSERVTTQIVRESSLYQPPQGTVGVKLRRLQDPATVAWNLCTQAFYKANGRPWKLTRNRDRVCYIGLVFKKTGPNADDLNACCGAQMFLDSGEGLVFRGALGPWHSPKSNQFHLSHEAARRLLDNVLKGYATEHKSLPKELFIHGQTFFNDEEWSGFESAVSSETKLVGIRIRRAGDTKIFRQGALPVIRGTSYIVSDSKAYLWTSGFVPELETYPGREVPNPLSVEIVRGRQHTKLETVLQDVMSLTKLNFNSCIYADGLPVTLRFANSVGEIIVAAPLDESVPPLPFKHYI